MLKKGQLPILIVNAIILIIFSIFYIGRKNYEFLGYIGVIVFFFAVILLTNQKVNYPNSVLWGLTLWSLMHLCGGSIPLNGARLYDWIIIPIVGEPYLIFKYDQLVHIIGFGVATCLMWALLKDKLRPLEHRVAVFIVVVMAGLGVGAFNEIVEFIPTIFIETGVGGYENTALDLVADLIGALLALVWIKYYD